MKCEVILVDGGDVLNAINGRVIQQKLNLDGINIITINILAAHP